MLPASSSCGMLSSTILITAATAIFQITRLLGSFIHFNTYIQGTGQNNLRQCAWSREGILPSARPWPTGFVWVPPGRPRWSAWSPPPCSAGTAPSQPKCEVDSLVSKVKGHLDHFRDLLEGVLTLLHPVFPLRDVLNGGTHLVQAASQLHTRTLLSFPANWFCEKTLSGPMWIKVTWT